MWNSQELLLNFLQPSYKLSQISYEFFANLICTSYKLFIGLLQTANELLMNFMWISLKLLAFLFLSNFLWTLVNFLQFFYELLNLLQAFFDILQAFFDICLIMGVSLRERSIFLSTPYKLLQISTDIFLNECFSNAFQKHIITQELLCYKMLYS